MHAGHGDAGTINPPGSVFIDAGNVKAPYTDSADSTVWAADVFVTGGKKVGGRFPVASTDDAPLFATRRQGKLFSYSVPDVADGPYTLSLLFVDTVKKSGKRMFNVFAEGERIESDLDIFARTGRPRTALALTYDLTVSGGTFELELVKGTRGQAVLSAFSLVPAGSPAPVAPATPSNFAATPASPTSVALSWSDISGLETAFAIERSVDGGQTFVPLVTLPANVTAYVDASAMPGGTYHYRVRALSDAGGGPSNWSTVASATTPPDVGQPGAPAAPSNLAAQPVGPTSVDLSWTNNAGNDTGMIVERAVNGGAFATLATLPANSTSHRDDTAAAGTAYAYRVRAANAAGTSAASNEAAATTPGVAPAAPSNLSATVISGTEVKLGWSDNSDDETGFVIERATDGGTFEHVATTVAGATEHADKSVTVGQTYVYRLRAANGFGSSDPSNTAAAAPRAPGGPIVWTDGKRSPTARAEASGAMVDGKLYTFGGFIDSQLSVTTRVDVYDTRTDSWSTAAPMPVATTHASTAVDGTTIWVAGFFINDGISASRQVYKYDTVTDAWSRGPDLPGARGAGALVIVGRELHFWGGLINRDFDSDSHWRLDLDNEAAGWVTDTPVPEGVNHQGGVVLNGKIYSIGGMADKNEEAGNRDTVRVYDPATRTWSTAASLPIPMGHFGPSTVVRNGRIVVVGGSRNGVILMREIREYDPVSDTWSTIGMLPAARKAAVVELLDDGRLIVTTGNGPGVTTTTWIGA